MPDYPKDQLWELYENLPKELQEAIWAEKNADFISDICSRNGINEDKVISEIAKNITYILLGLLPPNELAQVLEKEVKIEKKQAKQIALEINRFILLPVKDSLEALYKIEIKPRLEPESIPQIEAEVEPQKKIKKKDRYREPAE
ncbi:MAG: hypothetical protein COU42_02195 [Candidatus Nealsonbacteria bacterium CG10_big_fil_rev_8_21_14_0_10_36_24]|uniref:Uncharacterized protein n=2 Tax=Candidatus Nealsoniibacteriota TaxID=1817911 RepID=A0A2H0YRM3_9BACT|nr:MAG: hypothetical protein COU42_02195 [Candidatus Nealsonbacteria bacterium CG10_big_fil_rev_8_21_14_0_10_36_24]PIS40382.1 MAG: hypothetical protein COT32_00020 [Candidatus Nealsonbacteria bacterium CG08_land_8_20_14_0_20_36_22]